MSRVVELHAIVAGAPWRELTMVELVTDDVLTGVGEIRMVNKTTRRSRSSKSWPSATSSAGNRPTAPGSPGTSRLGSMAWPVKSPPRRWPPSTRPAGACLASNSGYRCGGCSAGGYGSVSDRTSTAGIRPSAQLAFRGLHVTSSGTKRQDARARQCFADPLGVRAGRRRAHRGCQGRLFHAADPARARRRVLPRRLRRAPPHRGTARATY